MTDAENQFETQFFVFASECEETLQHAAILSAIYDEVLGSQPLVQAFNKTPEVWGGILNALQGSAVIAIGRMFDPKSENYTPHRLINFCESNLQIFSRDAFEKRQRQLGLYTEQEIQARVLAAYEPSLADFKEIRRALHVRREIYENELRDMRHKIYAHRAVAGTSEVAEIASTVHAANTLEVAMYLCHLRQALHGLFFDGRALSQPPVLPAQDPVFSLNKIAGEVKTLLSMLKAG